MENELRICSRCILPFCQHDSAIFMRRIDLGNWRLHTQCLARGALPIVRHSSLVQSGFFHLLYLLRHALGSDGPLILLFLRIFLKRPCSWIPKYLQRHLSAILFWSKTSFVKTARRASHEFTCVCSLVDIFCGRWPLALQRARENLSRSFQSKLTDGR